MSVQSLTSAKTSSLWWCTVTSKDAEVSWILRTHVPTWVGTILSYNSTTRNLLKFQYRLYKVPTLGLSHHLNSTSHQ